MKVYNGIKHIGLQNIRFFRCFKFVILIGRKMFSNVKNCSVNVDFKAIQLCMAYYSDLLSVQFNYSILSCHQSLSRKSPMRCACALLVSVSSCWKVKTGKVSISKKPSIYQTNPIDIYTRTPKERQVKESKYISVVYFTVIYFRHPVIWKKTNIKHHAKFVFLRL